MRLIVEFAERRPVVQTEKFNILRGHVWNAENGNALRSGKFFSSRRGIVADSESRRAVESAQSL